MNDFYVYGHFKTGKDTPFYIGKGTGRRAWVKSGRSEYWNRVVNKYGYEVKLLVENLTEENAYEKEKELIAEVGLDNLTNVLEGGEGMSSEYAQKRSQDPNWRKNVKEAAQKRSQDPNWRKNVKEANQKTAQNPKWRKKMEGVYKSKEYRRKQKEGAQKRSQDPEYRKNLKEAIKNRTQDPEWRRKQKEAAQKRSQDPEWRRKQKKANQKLAQDPEWRRKVSEGVKRYWANKKKNK